MIVVAVSGLQAASAPAPGSEVARCLKHCDGVKVIGVDYDPMCTGLYETALFDEVAVLTPPTQWDAFAEDFEALSQKYGITAFIPCTDLDVELCSRHIDWFESKRIDITTPPPDLVQMTSKEGLSRLSRLAGFSLPPSTVINTPDELDAVDEMSFPVCVKGRWSGAWPAPSNRSARKGALDIANASGWPIIVQDWVIGEEYSVMAIVSKNSRLLGGAVMKKIGISETGTTWAGVTVEDNELMTSMQGLVSELDWQGPIEIDVVRMQNGALVLLDLNPRFPAWTQVPYDAGVNLPQMMISNWRGDDATPQWAPSGMAFSQIAEDRLVPLTDWLFKQAQWINATVQ